MYHCVTNRLVPAGIYLLKVNNRNTRARCEICSKLTIKTPDHHLVFLLLILNNFHTLFLCFYCQLWTCNCRLGCLYLCIGFHIEYNSSSTGILNFICSCFPAGNGMFKINDRNTRTQWNVYFFYHNRYYTDISNKIYYNHLFLFYISSTFEKGKKTKIVGNRSENDSKNEKTIYSQIGK